MSKSNLSLWELLGFGYPAGLRVFAVVTDFVFAKDAVVAGGLSLLHRRADANERIRSFLASSSATRCAGVST